MTILHTERLRLEPITDRHYDGMRQMAVDTEVMRFLNNGQPQAEEETQAGIERVKRRWQEWGYSWWALIDVADGRMIGAACLQHLDGESAHPLEIGWRLMRDCWGKGYASEAARAIVQHAFDVVGATEVYAVANPANAASIRIMLRLGMHYVGLSDHYDQRLATYRLPRTRLSDGITPFSEDCRDGVVDVILPIQQAEFDIPITLADQPDLLDIPGFYQRGAGNFWIALVGGKVVGTIALLDIGNGQGALRKMFVRSEYRGKEHGIAQRLLDTLLAWCGEQGIKQVFLGTTAKYLAAHRFYEKNGFVEIARSGLPATFPVMAVDSKFYQRGENT